jgi:hypothetical protein
VRERADALAADDAPAPPGDAPWEARRMEDRADKPLLVPPGHWSSALGVGFDYDRYSSNGTDSVTVSGTPQTETWSETDVRTVVAVPVTLRVGLLPGLEAWGRADYRAEGYYVASLVVDGVDYNYVRFVTNGPGGATVYRSNPTTAGLGDVHVGLRDQPWDGQPLLLGLELSLPTGVSRFESMLDFFNGVGTPAGNGEGVMRMRVSGDWGYEGLRSGLSFHASYEPSATETTDRPFFGISGFGAQNAVLGAEAELGGAYTFPWLVLERPGALVLGLMGRSVEADRWTWGGMDVSGFFSGSDLAEIAALGGLEFKRDDRLELSVTACQDLPRGLESRGKLAYTMDAMGDQVSISGQFLY